MIDPCTLIRTLTAVCVLLCIHNTLDGEVPPAHFHAGSRLLPRETRFLSSVEQRLPISERGPSGCEATTLRAVPADLAVIGDNIRFRLRLVGPKEQLDAEAPLRVALIFWNNGVLPLLPPSVIYATVRPGGAVSLDSGRVLVTSSNGLGRLVRSVDIWQKIGASASVSQGSDAVVVQLTIPLRVLASLCPDGVLVDLRLHDGVSLFSYGAAASWFEPPDPTRAVLLKWEATGEGGLPPSEILTEGESLSTLLVQPGVRLWALLRAPLPLDQIPCEKCDTVAHLKTGKHQRVVETINDLQQVALTLHAPDLAWQQTMLELQKLLLETGRSEESIDAGLTILEANGNSEATVVQSLRFLATAWPGRGGPPSDEGAANAVSLASRFLGAVTDSNLKAAYGADLLLSQGRTELALHLLKDVAANNCAPSGVRAHALFRLQHLSVLSSDFSRAVDFAQQLQSEVPFDLALRDMSLTLLRESGIPPESAASFAPAVRARLAGLRANWLATSTAICRRYFSRNTDSAGPSDPCPFYTDQER